ncbi:helix-turn-helix domain-containing protein [Limnoglobus roseus]|uniref:helix-turn-helix domain-containing protein n=1 Tax=Limnoglobus roseus TaxID=2598579 RepID=UPI00143D892A|nr:LuxR C-terminal-related transcriptional regulator [Limnoglobus roseus]
MNDDVGDLARQVAVQLKVKVPAGYEKLRVYVDTMPGRRENALRVIDEAWTQFSNSNLRSDNLKAGPHGSGGAGGAGVATKNGAALTVREGQVLKLRALGHTGKGTAMRLGISIKKTHTFKTRAVKKLNLHSRIDLVRYASRQGWLTDL